MITMNPFGIRKHLRVALKPAARAIGLAAGLSIGSAQALPPSVIDLGAFESGGTTFAGGALVSQIPLGVFAPRVDSQVGYHELQD